VSRSSRRKSVIIDCDPGIDDALNIIIALNSPELKIEAITTVSGNLHVEKTSLNALKILELAGRKDIPVARGAAKPLTRELYLDPFSHGEDGLGNTNLPPPKLELDKRPATDLLIELIRSSPNELTVITTGPLTNLATAIRKDREIARSVKQHIMMGGLFGLTSDAFKFATGGNPVSEWNIFVDPEAADIVINSGLETLAIGLDITTRESITVTEGHVSALESKKNRTSAICAKMMRYIMNRGFLMHLHDPSTSVYAVDNTIFKTEKFPVAIECESDLSRGQTIIDRRYKFQWTLDMPKLEVVTDVDANRFNQVVFDRLR
jgi:inosine-uridine nucleoside N-ribohydrolase